MKISEITQWIALLTKGKLDDGVARFGKRLGQLPGRDLVSVAPTDQRFEELSLEFDSEDASRLLMVDAKLKSNESISYTQLVQRFGTGTPMPAPVDDFSGTAPGEYFFFTEGKEKFSLSLFYHGRPDETVDVSRVSLRRVVPLTFAAPPKTGSTSP